MAQQSYGEGEAVVPYGPEQARWEDTLSPVARDRDGRLLVSPPTVDPLTLCDHSEREGVTSKWYQVPSTGLTEDQRTKIFAELDKRLERVPLAIGFQANLCNHTAVDHAIQNLLGVTMNNDGDPNCASPVVHNTKFMERNVLDYYASLWNAKWPHNPKDPESYWGYVLTMGSSEGNLHAIWNARDYLSGKYVSAKTTAPFYQQCECPSGNQNAFSPVGLYSHESHNSILKSLQVAGVPSMYELGNRLYAGECPLNDGEWPTDVPCLDGDEGPGTVDIQALVRLVDFFTRNGHPIIVVFSYGTTFKGAYDDVKAAGEALVPILKKNGMYERKLLMRGEGTGVTRKGFWFHVDGALSAAYAPFLHMASKNGLTGENPPPIFDFQLGFVSSIVTSGHKWTGCPWPCGIYISKTGLQLRVGDQTRLSYLASPDTTLGGSRNAHSPLFLWTYISSHSYEEQMSKALSALERAAYLERRLRELEEELEMDLWVKRSPASLAVCFKEPNCKSIIQKYSLPVFCTHIKGELRKYVHVFVMDHVTKETIDGFFEQLKLIICH